MWLDPNADGCVYDTVDCYHDCDGCDWAYPRFGGEYPEDDPNNPVDFDDE